MPTSASDQSEGQSCPSLPLTFFEQHAPAETNLSILPPELLYQCLASYSDWGELARLSATTNAWKSLLKEASQVSPEQQWYYADALWNGSHGLAKNANKAVEIWHHLAGAELCVEEDECSSCESNHVSSIVRRTNPEHDKPSPFAACAMRRLANAYLHGYKNVDEDGSDAATVPVDDGTFETDPLTGLQWMKAAYDLGNDIDAAYQVALAVEYGKFGIPADVVEAVAWFHKAADQGHAEAMAELGLCYELGLAVEQSDEQALDWYRQAADLGHAVAQYSMGEMFEQARGGVPQSDEEACFWYYQAAKEGCSDSREALRRLEDIARIVVPGVGSLLAAV